MIIRIGALFAAALLLFSIHAAAVASPGKHVKGKAVLHHSSKIGADCHAFTYQKRARASVGRRRHNA